MKKRKLSHVWKLISAFSYWYFLVLTIVCLLTAVYALRQNNITALKLRDNVLAVDKSNGDVESALNQLRGYVYAHMNTNLSSNTSVYPPIQLKFSYERALKAEKDRATKASSDLYNNAQDYCERTQPQKLYSSGRLACIQNYLDKDPSVSEKPIPDAAYKFDFVSPVWSPDLAGWSLVFGGIFGFLFALRVAIEMWIRNHFSQDM